MYAMPAEQAPLVLQEKTRSVMAATYMFSGQETSQINEDRLRSTLAMFEVFKKGIDPAAFDQETLSFGLQRLAMYTGVAEWPAEEVEREFGELIALIREQAGPSFRVPPDFNPNTRRPSRNPLEAQGRLHNRAMARPITPNWTEADLTLPPEQIPLYRHDTIDYIKNVLDPVFELTGEKPEIVDWRGSTGTFRVNGDPLRVAQHLYWQLQSTPARFNHADVDLIQVTNPMPDNSGSGTITIRMKPKSAKRKGYNMLQTAFGQGKNMRVKDYSPSQFAQQWSSSGPSLLNKWFGNGTSP